MKSDSALQFETKSIHSGEPRPFIEGAIAMPLFHSSTYEYFGEPFGEEGGSKLRYTRLGNTPNQICLEEKIAALEGGEAGIVTATGMAAISTALLALVGEGKHLLSQDSLYGGTTHFLQDQFPGLGRKVSFFEAENLDGLKKLLRPETAVIYVESVSNPLMKIPDLRAIVNFAKEHGLLSVIDNTFPSPFNFNPLSLGFDLVIHSATKYLNGHSDVVAGCAVGSRAVIEQIRALLSTLGASMDANTCFLLNRGLKTLGVRMRWHNDSTLRLVRALEKHPKVARILYPGLPSHPQHERARELFRGFSGMFAFEYAGAAGEAVQFMRRLKLAAVAPSLGGVESLVTRPVTTSHSYMSKEEMMRIGIHDTLVRVSVGLEAPEDLIADFLGALDDGQGQNHCQ